MNYYWEPTVDKITSITEVSTVEITSAPVTAESMAETTETVAVGESVFTMEEHAEAELVVTDWMLDGSSWYSAADSEEELILTHWMLTSEPWVAADVEINDLVILEDWMLDATLWNLVDEAMMVEEQEEIVILHQWMLSSDAWVDDQQPLFQVSESERLLTGNIID